MENAYRKYLKDKSYKEAVDPSRVSVLDEQRARAFAAREAKLLEEAQERKQKLQELKKKADAEKKSLKPIVPRTYAMVNCWLSIRCSLTSSFALRS